MKVGSEVISVSNPVFDRPSVMKVRSFLFLCGYQVQNSCPLFEHVFENMRQRLPSDPGFASTGSSSTGTRHAAHASRFQSSPFVGISSPSSYPFSRVN